METQQAAVKVIQLKPKRRCSECNSGNPGYGWESRPVGTRFACDSCKAPFICGRRLSGDSGTIFHRIFRRGITDRSVPSWQYFPKLKRVYINCPVCESLLPIALRDIDAKGFVGGKSHGSCSMCYCCNLHVWPFFEGWAEFLAERKKPKVKASKQSVNAKSKTVRRRVKVVAAV